MRDQSAVLMFSTAISPAEPIEVADMPQLRIRRATTKTELRSCIAIRFEVFVEEQQVPVEEEIDGIDDQCLHYIAAVDGMDRPVGTARLIPKGKTAKIGRVAVVRRARGQGVGLALMRFALGDAERSGFDESVLDSQTYAIPFYQRLGYVVEGDEFLDAGIPHYKMRLRLTAAESGRAY